MIMRIMAEGQFEVADEHLNRLNQLDDELLKALDSDDEGKFRTALDNLLGAVREVAVPVAADYLGPSDSILPRDGATIEEVRELLRGEGDGLIPGLPE
ncbi:hypothetical protein LN042_16800 [Kitasatospora sp. RB6PN24]|uniref:PspA-associated protein PspAA n=1 Tax=Kitasatospora humi TaxID=2893891 RepID=UPI001E45135B|nr:hypothetical protein [Kitasatospora humi]MCC9308721.1 hypothetical protein [Kitasatospora humi]